jgi:DNA-binding transcriptional regulator YiaG
MSTSLADTIQARRTIRTRPAHVRALRLELGLSLAEVARELGVTTPSVSRWETGRRIPRGDLAARYLELLRRLGEATS